MNDCCNQQGRCCLPDGHTGICAFAPFVQPVEESGAEIRVGARDGDVVLAFGRTWIVIPAAYAKTIAAALVQAADQVADPPAAVSH